MATEVTVERWCDVHLAVDDERVSASSYEVLGPGGRSRYVDLCDEHEAEFLGPVRELLSRFGTTKPDHPTRTTRPAPFPPERGTGYPCLLCEQEYGSSSGLATHYVSAHGYPGSANDGKRVSLVDVYAPADLCAVCGSSSPGTRHIPMHASEVGRPGLPALFRYAESIGDPHGMVAKVRASAPR